jgi:methionine synthase I (cobalamin-dependent)
MYREYIRDGVMVRNGSTSGGDANRCIVVLDGGMGHMIKAFCDIDRFGLPFERQGVAASLTCVRQPESVVRVHDQYIQAGCDVITSNSYSATPYAYDGLSIGSDYISVVQVSQEA